MILFTIGRELNNKYVITKSDDPNRLTSNVHAEIYIRDDGSICIIDKSANGTSVNGRRIEKEVEVSLNRGDKVVFAGAHLLNWDKVPSVTPPPPGWKIFSIGTAFNNRVQISDSTNNVSRFHATLKIDPKGRIFINDHSTNGTFVNGNRIPANQDYPVKRKDNIRFANTSLDWNRIGVKPSFPFVTFISSVAAVLIIAVGIFGYKNEWFPSIKHNETAKILTPEEIYAKNKNAVVMVIHAYSFYFVVDDNGKKLYVDKDKQTDEYIITNEPVINYVNATAFFIDSTGLMLTNRHVAMPWENDLPAYKNLVRNLLMKKYGFQFSDNVTEINGETVFIGIAVNNTDIKQNLDRSDFIDCAIINKQSTNKEEDVAFLRTKNRSLPNSSIQVIDINKVQSDIKKEDYPVGKNVYVLGYPLGLELSFATQTGTTNTVQIKSTCQGGSINSEADEYKFGVNAQMTHGASGSPVLDQYGHLIGVFNSGVEKTQGLNYAILAKYGKKLYDEIR